ncbi:hypothetical protein TNCT_404251 [Trichonephila clavata]|uniref:Uncharacterized protein n=1 Tax=Trichonephila clavata TaxID=2740835 RepID=A0A8X6LU71_TRICU|nr:hypothetical protein TNCT_404251 [Trichonephila clavata]
MLSNKQCLNLSWTAGYLSEQKMHPSTQQTWFKTVHEYFKDFDDNTGFHTTGVLRPLVGHPYSLGTIQRNSVYPLSRHRGFRFPAVSTRHVSLDYKAYFKPVNGPPKTFQDAMDPLRNKETVPGRSFEKSLSKQAHFWITVPRFDIRATFRAIPATVFIIQQAVF